MESKTLEWKKVTASCLRAFAEGVLDSAAWDWAEMKRINGDPYENWKLLLGLGTAVRTATVGYLNRTGSNDAKQQIVEVIDILVTTTVKTVVAVAMADTTLPIGGNRTADRAKNAVERLLNRIILPGATREQVSRELAATARDLFRPLYEQMASRMIEAIARLSTVGSVEAGSNE